MNQPTPITFMLRVTFLSMVLLMCLSGCARKMPPAPVVKIDTNIDESSKWSKAKMHTVQSGETLYGIAWLYGLDYQKLASNNALEEPYSLRVGQNLNLFHDPVKHPPSSVDTNKVTVKVPNTQAVAQDTDQVYREKTKRVSQKEIIEKLPQRVKRWQWPADGSLVGKFSRAEAGIKGIEIANTLGTPVVAAADGKVVYSGNALRGYGNLVIIKHTTKFLSAYAHNSKILVQERDFVQAGQQIAAMGDSGTNSVKLRFEIRYDGKSLNPLKYLPKQK